MLDNPIIIYGLIFIAALLATDTVMRMLFSKRKANQDVKNRLENLKLRQGADTAFTELLMRRGVRDQGDESFGAWVSRMVAQSGLELTNSRKFFYVLGFFVFGFLLTFLFARGNTPVQFGFAAVFTLVCCYSVIWWFRRKRIKRFQQQLPQAIDVIVRSLNAGHPLVAAISLVARELPDPIGTEFGILSDQMTFGSELEQAMLNMIDRVGAEELGLLAVTVSVQRGTGGNLSEILENLSKMIRDRLMIRQKIRAISAEGRITARIMLAFPFGLYFMIDSMVSDYFDPVWDSGYGWHVVAICLTFMFFGWLILRKLVNFDF